ncbi:DUF3794 and LysM peptidoglycan-binding domain-containing protein [Halothermothrix orenii]|uniref:Peptidoglycan-binding LysM n=1 Tax=Halothermothrix orenii (strain H 168 / OCM 544 / DSM 9562) TaxID=373903 RepID=B8D0E9_HALOH|nr:SPOCS domain-containing protein [Halothermothrix orenii]ACL70885.1 Peptidoglycan-binding LysM [Halothermothrix orenii H 168]
MPQQQLTVSEELARRVVDFEVVRNVGIPSELPPAERVVSANARLEITEATAGQGNVVINGIIRSTIFYASAEDPSNVVSIRRNFNFTERVNIPGARPGAEVNVDASIGDIDFYVINNRLLGIEFVVVADLEITVPETVPVVEEPEEVEFRRRRIRIRRTIVERNFVRELTSVERLPSDAEDIRRIIDVESTIQLIDIITGNNRVTIRGVVNNRILYVNRQGQLEFFSISFPVTETFTLRGVDPGDEAFVDTVIRSEEASLVDNRRIRFNITALFNILVVREEEVTVPVGVITPGVFPERRTVIVDRVVAEERTRVLARDQVTVPEGNPDIDRVIRATGQFIGGTVSAETASGGVFVDGEIAVNILYVADLPQQPVYFTSTVIDLNTFINIEGVTADMDAVVDAEVVRVSASRVSARQINVRVVVELNLVVTERVRIPLVIRVGEEPADEEGFITYTVQPGDTLFLISRRYGVSIARLVEINNIADPDNLRVGQQLLIPAG